MGTCRLSTLSLPRASLALVVIPRSCTDVVAHLHGSHRFVDIFSDLEGNYC